MYVIKKNDDYLVWNHGYKVQMTKGYFRPKIESLYVFDNRKLAQDFLDNELDVPYRHEGDGWRVVELKEEE